MKKVKGHWPKGRRRNPDAGDWTLTRLKLKALFAEQYLLGQRTPRAFATDLNIDPKTVWRWIIGRHRPSIGNAGLAGRAAETWPSVNFFGRFIGWPCFHYRQFAREPNPFN